MTKIYKYKSINYGFVILCPEYNIAQIKTTINSLKYGYPDIKSICVVPKKFSTKEIKEVKKYSTTYKGDDSITSMINIGMQYAPSKEWNFILISGVWLKINLNYKYAKFIEDEKDILYPIVERKCNFVDGTLNGILINKENFKKIGPFKEGHKLNICKLMWANDAINKGCRFKGIVGNIMR